MNYLCFLRINMERNAEDYCMSCTDRQSVAVGFCQECDEHLCQRCYDIHTIPKPSREHTVVKLDDPSYSSLLSSIQLETPSSSEDIEDIPNKKCKVHTTICTDLYCTDHRTIGCARCVFEHHKTCNVTDLLDVKLDYLFSDEVSTSFKDLENARYDVIGIQQQIEKNHGVSADSKSNCIASISEFRKTVDDKLNVLEADVKETVDSVHSHMLKAAEDYCRNALDKINTKDSKLKSYRDHKTPCKMYVDLKDFNDIKDQIKVDVENARSNSTVKTFSFIPCRRLRRSLFEVVKTMGTLEEDISGCDEYKVTFASLRVCPFICFDGIFRYFLHMFNSKTQTALPLRLSLLNA